MKKVLFIDRDGTLIVEPPITEQINNLDELELLPGVIRNLYKINKELDYEIVMVSNQDGLGTETYPETNFNIVQNKLLQILENEGIRFDAIYIDRSTAVQNLPTRKPGTAMLSRYMDGSYDLRNSFVIGDRLSDIQLAENLGAKAIAIQANFDLDSWKDKCALVAETWDELYNFLRLPPRVATVVRKTKETNIEISLNLDGKGIDEIQTGIGFFDHMLEQIARHGLIDLNIQVDGDLQVDEHHTIEDTGLALGEAFLKAIGDKKGLERYGFSLPMDDCRAEVVLDFGGRPWLVWKAKFRREKIGDMPSEMFYHFFKSFSDAARCNLFIKAKGQNEHHKIEAIFKAFARAVKFALKRDASNMSLPSTKGVL